MAKMHLGPFRNLFRVLHLLNFLQVENRLNLYLLDKQLLALSACSPPAEKTAGGEQLQDKLQNYHQRALGQCKIGDASHGFIVP